MKTKKDKKFELRYDERGVEFCESTLRKAWYITWGNVSITPCLIWNCETKYYS